jgi:hypothetical protein
MTQVGVVVVHGPQEAAHKAFVALWRGAIGCDSFQTYNQRSKTLLIDRQQRSANQLEYLLSKEPCLNRTAAADTTGELSQQMEVAQLQDPAVSICDIAAASKLIADDGTDAGSIILRDHPDDLGPSLLAFRPLQ